jgi:hypothetical protein
MERACFVGIMEPILVEIDTQNFSAQRALVRLTLRSRHDTFFMAFKSHHQLRTPAPIL